jgi:uncharacterized protein
MTRNLAALTAELWRHIMASHEDLGDEANDDHASGGSAPARDVTRAAEGDLPRGADPALSRYLAAGSDVRLGPRSPLRERRLRRPGATRHLEESRSIPVHRREVIFVDTGAFVARYVRQDTHHRAARRTWAEIEKTRSRCFTSNFVLDETFTLLGRRASCAFAADRARALLGSAALTILRPEAHDEEAAVELFAKFADQQVSFTDCVSFVLMRRNRLERAFSFDRRFRNAGFEITPRG